MYTPNLTFNSLIRIDFGKILQPIEGIYDILTSTYAESLFKLPVAGVYQVTTEKYRPDLISAKIYGEEQYKHILMLYNSLTSYRQIVNGLNLSYPSLTDIENLMVTQSLVNPNTTTRLLS